VSLGRVTAKCLARVWNY